MTPSDFYALLHSIQSSEIEVYHQGQAEYANDPDNIFANFDRISSQLGLTREQVLLVYALKHWDGIVSYVNGHRSQREDIRGRIKDLRMYLALLWGMVDDQNTIDNEDSSNPAVTPVWTLPYQDPISIYNITTNDDVIECHSERINGERLLSAYLRGSAEAFVSTVTRTVILARIRSVVLRCPSDSSSYFDLVLEPLTRQGENIGDDEEEIPGMVVKTNYEFSDNSLWYNPLKSGQIVTFRIDDEEFKVVVNKVEINKDDNGNDVVTYVLSKDGQIVGARDGKEEEGAEFAGVCPVCRYSSVTSSTGVFEDTVQNCVGVCPSCGFRGSGPTHAMISQELKTKGGLKEHEAVNISKILSIDQDGLMAKLRVLVGIEDFSVCFDALTSRKLLRFQVDQSTWFYATIAGLNRLESEALILDLIAKGRVDTLISGSSKGEGVEYYRVFKDDF